MDLGPKPIEMVARARAELRMGMPVALRGRDGAVALVAAAETVDAGRLAGLIGAGAATLAVTAHRAHTLKARVYDGDLARIKLPIDADLRWVHGVADPARDLSNPLMGPFDSLRDGDAGLHRAAIALCKAARLLPAALVVRADATAPGIVAIESAWVTDQAAATPVLDHVVSARVPLELAHAARLHIFRPQDGSDEHYAIEIGRPDRAAPVLARLHSACFTGDLLGSLKCDCGPQLRAALAQMGAEGQGVLLYLNQEGRGIGLANKMRAYALQDQGFDTVEANHRLGFEDDERDFRLGAAMLRKMGFGAVRLMTNNPAKMAMLTECGIDVAARVPIHVGHTAENARYLAVKAEKSGHLP